VPSSEPVRLVALDIDGTLLTSKYQLTQRTIAAIHAAQAADIEVVIATGRRHTFALRVLAALELPDPTIIISASGTVVRTRAGDLIARNHLPNSVALDLCALLDAHRDRLVFTFDKVDEAPRALGHPGSLLMEKSGTFYALFEKWVSDNRTDILELSPIEQGLHGDPPIQAMICGSVQQMRDVEAQILASPLAQHLAVHRTEYAARGLALCDILPVGCGKGVALAHVAESFGIPPAQVAAIGDNFNDLDMLEFAGHPSIMANGAPELVSTAAARGWQVAASNDDEGAAKVLENIVAAAQTKAAAYSTLAPTPSR